MLSVFNVAATTPLTTLASVKAQLGIAGDNEDPYLENQIEVVSSIIGAYLNVAVASDGTRTLGRETIVERKRLKNHSERLLLSRAPVVDVLSVVEDGKALDASEYELDGAAGTLQRLTSNDAPWYWPAKKVAVTYVAGWLLPGDDERNLPQDIEDAAIGLIKASRAARTRDPSIRGEEIAGVLRTEYWVGSVGDVGHIPPDIASKLGPYRNVTLQ